MARKIQVKLIMELRSAGMSQRSIAATRHMSRSSVGDVFAFASEKGLAYSDVANKSNAELYALFFPDKFPTEKVYGCINYEKVDTELKRPGVTLKLLWKEYKNECEKSGSLFFGYSKFCDGYSAYINSQNLTNRITHKPGYAIEVDWSGTKMHLVDRTSGELIDVYLFVAVLPFSQLTYIEPCLDMKEAAWIGCNVNMLEFFDGLPVKVICDNLKTGVTEHPREGEIELNDTYAEFGEFYELAIMPAAVRKPKQKASVEGAVGKIASSVIAPLRDRVFTTLDELKKAVREELNKFNTEPFQKRDGSRYEVYEAEEKHCLRALPVTRYEFSQWTYGRKVQPDSHVVFEKNYYSCPFQYVSKNVDVRATSDTISLYCDGKRITSHPRFPSYTKGRYSTHEEDLPEQFNRPDWDGDAMLDRAGRIGTNTLLTVQRIFESVSIKEQAYNAVNAVLRLAKTYSEAALEQACKEALERFNSPRYRHLKAILSEGKLKSDTDEKKPVGYVRGAEYYSSILTGSRHPVSDGGEKK